VSGAPTAGENPGLAWEDDLVNTSEYFHLFIIEGQEDARLPYARIGLNIKWVESVEAWRTVKVRILNGAHTSMIPYAMLLGIETVGDCLRDARTRAHLDACLVQILRSMDGDEAENRAYAAQVLTRFENPYIRHLCAAISLNSVSKFRVRVLPSILAYREKTGQMPTHLLFALSQLIRFYRVGTPRDSEEIIERFRTRSVFSLLADVELWGVSLAAYTQEVARDADSSL
jgi:tagaturonate reductase